MDLREEVEQLHRKVEQLLRATGGGAVRPADPGPSSLVRLCQVDGAAAAGGKGQYDGTALDGSSDADGAGNVALPEGLEEIGQSTGEALLVNAFEDGAAYLLLDDNEWLEARWAGWTAAGKPIYVAWRPPRSVLFGVKVWKDGGVNGTKTGAATWTYTVKTLGARTLATGVALSRTRPNGTVTYAADGSYGVAFLDGATLKLWEVDERYGTGGC